MLSPTTEVQTFDYLPTYIGGAIATLYLDGKSEADLASQQAIVGCVVLAGKERPWKDGLGM